MDDTELRHLQLQLQTTQDEVRSSELSLGEIQRKIDGKNAELLILEGHVEKTDKNLGTLSLAVTDCINQKAALESQIIVLDATRAQSQTELSDIQSKLSLLKDSLDRDLAALKETNAKEIAIIEGATKTAKDELTVIQDSISKGRTEISRITTKQAELSEVLAGITATIEEKTQESVSLTASIEEAKEKKTKEVAEMKASISETEKLVKEADENLLKVQEQLTKELAVLDKTQKEAFGLLQKLKTLDIREKDLNAKEQKVISLYEKAGVTI